MAERAVCLLPRARPPKAEARRLESFREILGPMTAQSSFRPRYGGSAFSRGAEDARSPPCAGYYDEMSAPLPLAKNAATGAGAESAARDAKMAERGLDAMPARMRGEHAYFSHGRRAAENAPPDV